MGELRNGDARDRLCYAMRTMAESEQTSTTKAASDAPSQMTKTVERKPDGRTIIYYSFAVPEAQEFQSDESGRTGDQHRSVRQSNV